MDMQHQSFELQNIRKEIQQLRSDDEKFVTVAKVARATTLTPRRIRQLCEEGKIKATQPGKDKGRWIIPISEMNRLAGQAKENHFNTPL